jgi:hypothetical protein
VNTLFANGFQVVSYFIYAFWLSDLQYPMRGWLTSTFSAKTPIQATGREVSDPKPEIQR